MKNLVLNFHIAFFTLRFQTDSFIIIIGNLKLMLKFFNSNIFKSQKFRLKKENLYQIYPFSTSKSATEDVTIFDKIVSGDIKCDKVYEDTQVNLFLFVDFFIYYSKLNKVPSLQRCCSSCTSSYSFDS